MARNLLASTASGLDKIAWMSTPNIFISYRRGDTAGHAGRLFDRLSSDFGSTQVFMDVVGIEPGLDFHRAIESAIAACDVLLVVIGRDWVTCTDATGRRRLEDVNDFVVLETITALERDVRVVPVLVEGATLPSEQELPDKLKPLLRRNAFELRDNRWNADVRALSEALKRTQGPRDARSARPRTRAFPWVLGSVLVLVGALAIVAATRWDRGPRVQPPQVEQIESPKTDSEKTQDPGPKLPPAPRCPKGMVFVPRRDGSTYAPDDESGETAVQPNGFCIDETEITVNAYDACVSKRACPPATRQPVWENLERRFATFLARHCNGSDAPKHPMNCVDVSQAEAYCSWVGKRLPTGSEWRLAASGRGNTSYPWGDTPPSARLLNACGSECQALFARDQLRRKPMYQGDDGWPATAPVGSFPTGASAAGVLDMAGNVWEWVAEDDRRRRASDRTVCGGGWDGTSQTEVRVDHCDHVAPSSRGPVLGFRCAKTPS